MESGRRVRASAASRGRTRTGTAGPGYSTLQVRQWARSQGIDVADRGRIPHDLVVKFQAAYGA
jgi:hypothetical protein